MRLKIVLTNDRPSNKRLLAVLCGEKRFALIHSFVIEKTSKYRYLFSRQHELDFMCNCRSTTAVLELCISNRCSVQEEGMCYFAEEVHISLELTEINLRVWKEVHKPH